MAETLSNAQVKTGQSLPRLAYSMQEVASILGVSYITVHRLIARGLLKSSSALRHKLIPLSEVERFLKATTA
jgi:excisionase family DNA binding protein